MNGISITNGKRVTVSIAHRERENALQGDRDNLGTDIGAETREPFAIHIDQPNIMQA